MAASRILVALAIAAGLAAPATADAASGSHASKAHTAAALANMATTVKAAQAAGRRYWGATPCDGQVRITARRPRGAGVDPTTDAWATFDSSLGKNNLDAPASTYRNCAISLTRWRWPTAASMSEDWDLLCATVIHETGHLLGRQHDLRPGSVMAPVFDQSYRAPPICRSARPRAARR